MSTCRRSWNAVRAGTRARAPGSTRRGSSQRELDLRGVSGSRPRRRGECPCGAGCDHENTPGSVSFHSFPSAWKALRVLEILKRNHSTCSKERQRLIKSEEVPLSVCLSHTSSC